MEVVVKKLFEMAAEWGVRVVGVIVALLLAWILAGWARRAVLKALELKKLDPTLSRFFASTVRYVLLIAAMLGCLGVFGIETASFAAVIGAAGVAIGLAFKGTLSNFAAGVMLLIFRPFKVGEFIKIADISGTVCEIDLFTTELTTPDNRKIIVPNDKVFGSPIENFTHHPTRRVDVPVGVAYDADVHRTREVLAAMVPKIEGVLQEPPPQIFLSSFGDSSVNWVVRVWSKTPDFWNVHQATIEAIKRALDEAEIAIPFPQVDVHLDKAA